MGVYTMIVKPVGLRNAVINEQMLFTVREYP
jgi:hypothetical protein